MISIDDEDQEDENIIEDQYEPFSEEEKKPRKRSHKTAKQKKLEEENSLNFWKTVLRSVTGRREMWGIFIKTKAFDDTFGCSPNGTSNDQETFFHLGKKSFGLKFYYELMAIDPEAIVAMHKENDPRVMK
jgi:hypothetical protein